MREPTQLAIECIKITVGYRGLMILDQLSLQVKAHAITLLIGPNGAGKSTVLKTLFGMLTPWQGSIHHDGQPITETTVQARLQRGMAFIPQGRHLFGALSVYENLELGGITLGKKITRARLPNILDRFPQLQKRLHVPASAISGGEQKQLEIARALLLEPKIILVDEPLIGLSPQIAHQVLMMLRDLSDQGVTILMVEQNVRSALKIADDVVALVAGRAILHTTAAQLSDPSVLEQLFLGQSSHR